MFNVPSLVARVRLKRHTASFCSKGYRYSEGTCTPQSKYNLQLRSIATILAAFILIQ